MTRTHRDHRRHDDQHDEALEHSRPQARKRREPSPLLTVAARVRSVSLTPQGHLACVLDTNAGRLKALSDAAGVHLPEFAVGREVQVALLRLKRVTDDAGWHWQLLGCRGLDAQSTHRTERAGSAA